MTGPADAADSELAERAARGDQRAYAELVRRHKDGLYRMLRRYAGDPDEAYEAAQEAFIAAWQALGRYDPARPFSAWLRAIAINKARDRGRRSAVRRLLFGARSFEDSGVLAQASGDTAADDRLVERQELAQLDGAIGRLPAGLKAALVLTALDGHSQIAAADILGVTPKAIETRVRRARQILAGQLDRALRPQAGR